MNALINFNYKGVQIRTQRDEVGEPLFCLADVCKVLDGNQPNKVAEAIREEFGCPELNSAHVVDALGRAQEATFVTEPQLYFVMMRSRSEFARPFRQWVVNEVLPSIRKTGKYESGQMPDLKQKLELAKLILEPAGIEGNQLTLALDKVTRLTQARASLNRQGYNWLPQLRSV